MIPMLLDLLRTPIGKIFAAIVTIFFAGYLFLTLRSKDADVSATAEISRTSPWDDDFTENNPPPMQTKRYDSFQFFQSVKSDVEKTEPPQPIPKKKTSLVKKILPRSLTEKASEPRPPLMYESASPTKKPTLQQPKAPSSLPQLEQGAMIHCQLSTPATTDHSNAPITAHVTRTVIRDGIPIIPRGSKIFGNVQTSRNDRIFFDTSWSITTPSKQTISITGHAQQKSHDAHDGRLGLVGFLENQPQPSPTGKKLLSTLIKGAAELSKDTARTEIGEYIPSTGRNAVIRASQAIIDGALPQSNESTAKQEPYRYIPAGREFYLVVSATDNTSQQNNQAHQPSIEQLQRQLIMKRLER